jgi:1-acyl-sn-glycerol-3-phosphate acyltransferase
MINATAIVCIAAGLVFALRVRFWVLEGKKMQTAGYLPPEPTWFGRTFYKVVCHVGFRFAGGPITVIGRENADYDGPLAIAPNHQHGLDFAAIRVAMPWAYRQIGALKEVIRFPGMAAICAWVGTFTVPVQAGKAKTGGQAAIDACARYLCQRRRNKLLMFPQGKLVFDNVLRPEDFRTGAVRALQAAHLLISDGYAPAFLPVAIYYHPTSTSATRFRRTINWLWRKLLPGYGSGPVYGATVVIGKPILITDLPTDIREATEILRVRIQELLDQAIAAS